jgi:hypothetical protein
MAYKGFGRKRGPADTLADAIALSADKSLPDSKLPSKRRPRKPRTIVPDSRKAGRLTDSEKSIITNIIAESPGDITPAQTEALAITMRREPDTIADAVAAARVKLQENLGRYVDIHREAAELALATDDPDVARKASEFMITHVSARRKDGKVERLIEAPASEPNGPRIQIGIALGGVPAAVTARTD